MDKWAGIGINIFMAIVTGGFAALASYYATQKVVSVALAKLEIEITWIKKEQKEHKEDAQQQFREQSSRLTALERATPIRHRP